MLKTRLIPVLFIKNGLIVRSEDYSTHQIIGNVINEAKRYNDWNVDELMYIDISRDNLYDSNRDDHRIEAVHSLEEIVTRVSEVCFMPLAFGGGIRSLEQAEFLIRNGADKITLNTAVQENPDLVRKCVRKFGSQAVVVSIDYRNTSGKTAVFTNFGRTPANTSILDWVKEAEQLGAGELMISNIDFDGKSCGYDIPVIGEVVESTSLPVIACSGAGDAYDFVDLAKETKVSAIAAGNWFHFVERSYPRAKELLKKNNIHVR